MVWNKERCLKEALKCKSRSEFKKKYRGAENSARKNGWMDEICSHMVFNPKCGRNIYSKERCLKEALKYTSRTEFRKRSSGIYYFSKESGWLDEICSHIKKEYWNKERCLEEALKYKHKSDFGLNSRGAYFSAKHNRWFDEITSHMVKKSLPILSKEECRIEALKYSSTKDLKNHSYKHYTKIKNERWLQELCQHMFTHPRFWSDDMLCKEALKYNYIDDLKSNNYAVYNQIYKRKIKSIAFSHMQCGLKSGSEKRTIYTFEYVKELVKKTNSRKEFREKYRSACAAAHRNGWMPLLYPDVIVRGNNYWSFEKCKAEALKYDTRFEFQKGSRSAYGSSVNNNWLDEICSHMRILGSKYSRCIYAFEFPDNHVYVGLTDDLKEREYEHFYRDKKSSVKNHYDKTKLEYNLIQLSDYVSIEEAVKLEDFFLNDYISKGWIKLNIAKTGSLGGDFKKWGYENCKKEALKYESRWEFQKANSGAYGSSFRNGWLDDVCSHMKLVIKPTGYWTIEKSMEIALSCSSRKELYTKYARAYSILLKNNKLNDIFEKKGYGNKCKINE